MQGGGKEGSGHGRIYETEKTDTEKERKKREGKVEAFFEIDG